MRALSLCGAVKSDVTPEFSSAQRKAAAWLLSGPMSKRWNLGRDDGSFVYRRVILYS